MVKATAKMHVDVRGKTQYYVLFDNGKEQYLINVGEKTYNTVKELDNKTATPAEKGAKDK